MFFFILMIAAMFATLGILILGVITMVKGGEFNKKYGNKLMRARIWMQGVALALFVVVILTSGNA